jgi:hypothetical protein
MRRYPRYPYGRGYRASDCHVSIAYSPFPLLKESGLLTRKGPLLSMLAGQPVTQASLLTARLSCLAYNAQCCSYCLVFQLGLQPACHRKSASSKGWTTSSPHNSGTSLAASSDSSSLPLINPSRWKFLILRL